MSVYATDEYCGPTLAAPLPAKAGAGALRLAAARYGWGVAAALLVVLITSVPQLNVLRKKGAGWQGAYAVTSSDEVDYSAHLGAVIDRQPRRYDPLTDSLSRGETFYSIQFVPAYALALPARLFGADAAATFMALHPLAAFLSAFSVFLLLSAATVSRPLAAAGAVFVLLLGTFAAGAQWLNYGFPFLRRYQPSAAFPLFFLLCLSYWRALVGRRVRVAAFISGCLFSLLVFSYFYLWTAAVAWVACLSGLWLAARRDESRKVAAALLAFLPCPLLSLTAYAYLIVNRVATSDRATVLESSRAPDLFQAPELIGFAVLAALLIWGRGERLRLASPPLLLAASLALLPALALNQQIVTGRSLQPFHYSVFIVNYAALLSLVLLASQFFKRLGAGAARAAVACVAAAGLAGGIYQVRNVNAFIQENSLIDHIAGVGRHISRTASAARGRELTFASHPLINSVLPTYSSRPVLWSVYMFNSDLTAEEREGRYFLQLYFSGVGADGLGRLLEEGDAVAICALFGPERALPVAVQRFEPITGGEAREAVARYSTFLGGMSAEHVARHKLSYLITYPRDEADYTNLRRWYDLGVAEKVGPLTLYRLKPLF
jgi:hypothetical protein